MGSLETIEGAIDCVVIVHCRIGSLESFTAISGIDDYFAGYVDAQFEVNCRRYWSVI